ncbi:hypothetical protein [Microbacterium sp. Root280D1]|uniref:hypothetical protein n=1 Tax=Microbacterium sp. Root280D1 TaxID=1736510 RepID=UPI0006FD9E64|nr:hypothetical protein [Microbacterium sp. Root280D1]KRD51983.1 hypothetical protein ASE34_08690 [Microbacterium sp. Root280D1]
MHRLTVALAATTPPAGTGPGPWELTLDTLIAGMGALVTIVLTVLALLQTKRANALQTEAHRLQQEVLTAQARLDERQRRFRLYQVMLPYIEAVEKDTDSASEYDAMVITSVENGFGHDAPELEWVSTEAHELADAYRRVARHADGSALDQTTFYAHAATLTSLRRRLAHWVETGEYPKEKTWSAAPPKVEQ